MDMIPNTQYAGEVKEDGHPVMSKMIGKDRHTILKTAGELIDGERARDYGDATEMHRRIAAGWSEILGVNVRAHEVALCMVWLKMSRIVETPNHSDSYVDGVAYMALAGEIQSKDSAGRG